MTIPLQIHFRNLEPSAALERRIRRLAARLDEFSCHIMYCQVDIRTLPANQEHGDVVDVGINISVPGKDLVVRHAQNATQAREDAYHAVRESFRAARR